MASLDEEEKHIEGLKNYRGLNKFKRACLNMNLDSNGKNCPRLAWKRFSLVSAVAIVLSKTTA